MSKTLRDVLESFDFNRAALAKQRLANLRRSGRRVHGARIANLMRAAGLREEEMEEEDLDQLDEVLSKDATASDWIHDFVHSTNPKFEGKTKKERIKMALGAYYAKQRNEEVEKIDEISKYGHERYQNAARKNIKDTLPHMSGEYGDIAKNMVNRRIRGLSRSTMLQFRDKIKKQTNESKEDTPPFDKPYKKAEGDVKDKSGAVHTAMSRARDLARKALQKQKEKKINEAQYAGLEKEDKPGKIKTAIVKTHPKAVESDTVEGWKDAKKPVKEESGDLESKQISYVDFINLMEGKTQYMVKLHHPDKGHTIFKTYTAEKGENDYDIKRRAQVDHGRSGYNIESIRKKDTETYEADDEHETNSTPQKRGRGRPAGSKSGARGPRIK